MINNESSHLQNKRKRYNRKSQSWTQYQVQANTVTRNWMNRFCPGNGNGDVGCNIADCIKNCGDHGQGTQSGDPQWRAACMSACTDHALTA